MLRKLACTAMRGAQHQPLVASASDVLKYEVQPSCDATRSQIHRGATVTVWCNMISRNECAIGPRMEIQCCYNEGSCSLGAPYSSTGGP